MLFLAAKQEYAGILRMIWPYTSIVRRSCRMVERPWEREREREKEKEKERVERQKERD